jgi:hypothetical protein
MMRKELVKDLDIIPHGQNFVVPMAMMSFLREHVRAHCAHGGKKVLTPLIGGEPDVRGLQAFAYGVMEEGNLVLSKTEPEGPCRG